MLRIFIGLELPDAVADAVSGAQAGMPGVRWVAAESLHLTLSFIGEVGEGEADDLDAALATGGGPRPRLALSGVGHFGRPPRPTVLWAGLQPSEELQALRRACDAARRRAGQPADKQSFRPHVTLGRTNRPNKSMIAEWLSHHGLLTSTPFTVSHLTLFSSHLAPGGAEYEALRRYPLG